MPYEQLKLDNQICFALYAASKELIRLYKPLLDPLGITYTQYLVLLVLWERNPISLKELGNTLYLDSGTLSPLLKKMEEQQILVRKRNETDERTILIHLTPNGIHLEEQAKVIPEQMLCHSGLRMEEALAIHQQLNVLLEKLSLK